MLGNIVGVEAVSSNKTDRNTCPHGAYILVRADSSSKSVNCIVVGNKH